VAGRLGILAFDAPAPREAGVLSAIAVSGGLIAVGIVGLANASSTRRLYLPDPRTTDTVGNDHGGVERQPCS
jgi:hypothetical protein